MEQAVKKKSPVTDIKIELGLKKDDDDRVKVYIDGPYGTPSAHIFQAEHAVLIGTGIGVTPFASILQSIMSRFKHTKQVCPNCNHCWTGVLPPTILKLKKVDLFWINRHQKHFEWFVSLLSELEIEQSEGDVIDQFLDMHMYITSALKKTDAKAVILQMALDLIHQQKNIDLITGLQTCTQPGRPNWDKVFSELDKNKRGQVTVFFCGSPVIGRILQKKCTQYGFKFHKENF